MQCATKTPDEIFEDMRAFRARPTSTWVHAPGCSHRVDPGGIVVHLCVDGCKIKAKGGVNAIPRRVWDTHPRRKIRAERRARKQRRGWA